MGDWGGGILWMNIAYWRGRENRWPAGFVSHSTCAQPASIWPLSACPIFSWQNMCPFVCASPASPVQMSRCPGFWAGQNRPNMNCSEQKLNFIIILFLFCASMLFNLFLFNYYFCHFWLIYSLSFPLIHSTYNFIPNLFVFHQFISTHNLDYSIQIAFHLIFRGDLWTIFVNI